MEAFYFDGRSSRRHTVRLTAEPGMLLLDTAAGTRRVPLSHIRVSEPQGLAPRTLRFPDDDFCEIPQGEALRGLLEQLGYRDSVTVRLQSRWRFAIPALLSIVAVICAAYWWGVPYGAKIAAPLVPMSAMNTLSEELLEEMDEWLFKPSALPADRQRALSAGFDQLVESDPDLSERRRYLRLYFRKARMPNALTFPGGQIVLLDGLVELSKDNDEVLAVLAHEIGHFRERHGARQLIQSSLIAAFMAVYLGDVSSMLSLLPTVLLEANYSRNMEREADDYAVAALRRLGRSPALLGSMLGKLEKRLAKDEDEDEEDEKPTTRPSRKVNDWLASHPNTDERIRRLQESD